MGTTFVQHIPLLPVAVSLVLGIIIGASLSLPFLSTEILLVLFFIAVLATLFTGKHPVLQTVLILTSVFFLGMFLTVRKQCALHQHTYPSGFQLMEAVIASEPAEKARSISFDLIMVKNGRKVKCYVAKDNRSRQLTVGYGLVIKARIEPFAEIIADGFRYQQYMERNGYWGQCYVRADSWQPRKLSLKGLSIVTRARLSCLRIRHSLLERYRLAGATDDRYGVLAAMTLGDKSALTPAIREVYAVSGASHILALSGMHLGIFYMLVSLLTFSRRRPYLISQILLIAAIWAFALLTGLSTSVTRAALMLSIYAVFSIGFRGKASLNVLCLSAIILLLQNPFALYDVGFQLSFMAVLSILLIGRSIETTDTIGTIGTIKKYFVECLKVSLAAQIGVAPLLAFYFGRFSTYFLITNLVVLPAAYIILIGSLLMLLVPWPPLSSFVIGTVDWLNNTLTQMNRWLHASIEGLHPSVLQIILYYLLVACLLQAVIIWKGRHPKKIIRWDI